ncbi:MAG TPA: hypothetical protein PJ997_00800 [Candidatus Paceibacterota bacterium]|nr:hypothetical protein [Candidatus Paceibacterota bacterium]HMP18861.1 hypothetical protein [Candidatus Paceibacterota bacterium]HMP85175.1 hypothetical protein [Candidatus Paceibacterota bacterium]
MIKRIIFGIFAILGAFLFPWWLAIIISFFGILYFDNFYEIILVGIILDSLYGKIFTAFGFGFWITASMFFVFYIVSEMKKSLLIKNKI